MAITGIRKKTIPARKDRLEKQKSFTIRLILSWRQKLGEWLNGIFGPPNVHLLGVALR